MSFITIAVHCHNYQRRMNWMLSSLQQQTRLDIVSVNIAHVSNNGAPRTEDLIDYYSESIAVRGSLWNDYSIFQRRGFTRNRQLSECSTEWLLFADCDMVYHPEYFERLHRELLLNHHKATYLLSAGRFSTQRDLSNALVESSAKDCPALIPNAFYQASSLPLTRKRNVGAGFSQIINVKYAPHEGYYVPPDCNPDWSWSQQFHKTKSDRHFRVRISERGGPRVSLPEWFSEGLIHLNHNRDKECSYHLEEQR